MQPGIFLGGVCFSGSRGRKAGTQVLVQIHQIIEVLEIQVGR